MAIEPYLFFNGRCEEAIEFYMKALGPGFDADALQRSPEHPPLGWYPGWENKICIRACVSATLYCDAL